MGETVDDPEGFRSRDRRDASRSPDPTARGVAASPGAIDPADQLIINLGVETLDAVILADVRS